MRLSFFFLVLVFLPAAMHAEGEYEYTYHRIEAPIVSSDNLKDTTVTPSLEAPLNVKKNLVYAAACQLAWNELVDKFVREAIRLRDAPDYAASLNKRLYAKEDLSPSDYFVFADYATPENRAALKKALIDKFGYADLNPPDDLGKDGLLIYAYLAKGVAFANPFQGDLSVDFPGPAGSLRVSAFGLDGEDASDFYERVKAQVKIDYYDPVTRQCVVRLLGSAKEDEIILALIPPGKTLLDTINDVKSRLKDDPGQPFHSYDTLRVPKLVFKIKHAYRELCDKPILNFKNGNEYYYFKYAEQFTDFRLDERGAELKVKVEYGMEATGMRRYPDRKIMVFDRPFLVMLKEKSAAFPYFAVWVANPELLFPYDPELFAPKKVSQPK